MIAQLALISLKVVRPPTASGSRKRNVSVRHGQMRVHLPSCSPRVQIAAAAARSSATRPRRYSTRAAFARDSASAVLSCCHEKLLHVRPAMAPFFVTSPPRYLGAMEGSGDHKKVLRAQTRSSSTAEILMLPCRNGQPIEQTSEMLSIAM